MEGDIFNYNKQSDIRLISLWVWKTVVNFEYVSLEMAKSISPSVGLSRRYKATPLLTWTGSPVREFEAPIFQDIRHMIVVML